MEAKPSVKADASAARAAAAGGGDGAASAAAGPPLFEEFYDDWPAFDLAVASAVAKHHPIRKRSSLTFDVYNRTVSKGKHDRRSIAEFLSKTFKCTHGIKFRPRSSGKRSRHKLRDIGCPFHLYASAVEFGPTYRVKVRVHDQHNHPIGPDAVKAVSSMRSSASAELPHGSGALSADTSAASSVSLGSDSPTLSQASAAASAASVAGFATMDTLHASASAAFVQQVAADARANQAQAQAQTEALSQAFAQVHAQALLRAQEQVHALSHARAAHAMLQSHHVQTSAALMGHEGGQPSHGGSSASDLLGGSAHDSESLLARAIESSIDDEVFISGGPSTAVPATAVSASVVPTSSADEGMRPAHKFEPTLTLEALRKRVAEFADERDWNQFHTPRNLLLALTGEVGELCEIFQWKGECKNTDDWSAEEKEHLGEELSDVMIYLIRLADKCNVDLPAALNDKIVKNGVKHPAELVKGSSKKYNQCKRMRLDKESI